MSSTDMSNEAVKCLDSSLPAVGARPGPDGQGAATVGTARPAGARKDNVTVVVAAAAKAQAFGAAEVSAAITEGVHATLPSARVLRVPDIDTGTSFIEQVVDLYGGRIERISLLGPHGELALGQLGLTGQGDDLVAVIAAEEAVELTRDLHHLPDLTAASSRAIGQLITAALDRGARRVIVGCGDSGACDGGIGMAGELGIRFLDADRAEIVEAGGLLRLAAIDMSHRDPRLPRAIIEAVVDPGHALLGIDSTVAASGPQRAASPTQVLRLEQGLARFAKIVRQCLGVDVAALPGAGAAGGLAAGLAAFAGARVISRADFLDQLEPLRAGLASADMVIIARPAVEAAHAALAATAESDHSCSWLERKAASLGLPVIALAPERLLTGSRLDEAAQGATAPADDDAAQRPPAVGRGSRLPAASAASLRHALGGWHRPAESV